MPPYRVALLAACPYPTHQGTQVFIRHFGNALHSAGHLVHLIAYGYSHAHGDCGPSLFAVHRPTAGWAGLRSGPHPGKIFANMALAVRASRSIVQCRSAIVHAHGLEALALGLWLRRRFALAVVYHSHTAMDRELPTYFTGGVARAAAHGLGMALELALPRQADAVIAFDSHQASRHVEQGVLEANVFTIPPGIDAADITAYDPKILALWRSRLGPGPLVLYAGNPDGYQNLGLLWQSFARLRRHRPDVRLLVATPHQSASFGAAARGDGVVVVQHESVATLRALYALAHVAVCTRRLAAGFPIKVLNALSCGLPVVMCARGNETLTDLRSPLPPQGSVLVAPNVGSFTDGLHRALLQAAHRRRPLHGSCPFMPLGVKAQVPDYERVYEYVAHRPKEFAPSRRGHW